MVFLQVYEKILDWVKEQDFYDDMQKDFETLYRHLLEKNLEMRTYYEMLCEFILFYYDAYDLPLIENIPDSLIEILETFDWNEIEILRDSQRLVLNFCEKKALGKKDTFGKDLFEFTFIDTDNDEKITIISSTALDKLGSSQSMRVVPHPEYLHSYFVTSVIINGDIMRHLESIIDEYYCGKSELDEKVFSEDLFAKSDDITFRVNYEQDLVLLELFDLCHSYFIQCNLTLAEYLEQFYTIMEQKERFIALTEEFLKLYDKILDCIKEAEISVPYQLLFEKELIYATLAYIKGDFDTMRKEYESMNASLCDLRDHKDDILREENFIFNTLGLLEEKNIDISESEKKAFVHLQKTDFEAFKKDFIDFIRSKLNEDKELQILYSLLTITLQNQVVEDVSFEDVSFYRVNARDNMLQTHSLFIACEVLLHENKVQQAYRLLQEEKPDTVAHFHAMFTFGKIYNMCENSRYKKYFQMAKKTHKQLYATTLASFLDSQA